MGSAAREKPERLAGKLLQIRLSLGLSQDGMLARLEVEEKFFGSRISAFETGAREPSLLVLLKYARLAGVSTDVLIDDELDLPSRLLKAPPRDEVRHKRMSKANRKR
jgi:transcriptional regulator with XRE-family HTH domain